MEPVALPRGARAAPDAAWEIVEGTGPLVAAAIHAGGFVRPDAAALLALDAAARRREEDPFTDRWTQIAPTRIVGRRSRFELDLNRPTDRCVYLTPEDAWGLRVWRRPPPDALLAESRALHAAFYEQVRLLLSSLLARHERLVVFDLHNYNHRRGGPHAPPADAQTHPEINLGTASLDRAAFGPLVERFLAEVRRYDYFGRRLDIRENVKFYGGHFPRWIHATFPGRVAALAIEVKKFFMDEWTGEPDLSQVDALGRVLRTAAEGVLQQLEAR